MAASTPSTDGVRMTAEADSLRSVQRQSEEKEPWLMHRRILTVEGARERREDSRRSREAWRGGGRDLGMEGGEERACMTTGKQLDSEKLSGYLHTEVRGLSGKTGRIHFREISFTYQRMRKAVCSRAARVILSHVYRETLSTRWEGHLLYQQDRCTAVCVPISQLAMQ